MKTIVAATIFLVAVAVTSAYAWHWYRLPARVQAALPKVPADVANKPAELGRRIAAATEMALNRKQALDGVGELGRLYHANGYVREAQDCWRLLRAERPRDARSRYFLADLRRTAGDDAEVASLLAETVKLAPDYAPAWLRLADLEFKTGHSDPAETHYSRRLALVAADPYARLGLARVALQRGNRDAARQLIEQIIHDTPSFSTAHNLYAEMLTADGRTDEAFRHRNLGREAGRFREADDPWLEELSAWCFDPKRLALIGTMAYQTRRGDRGVSALQRAVDLAPDDPANYEMLGTQYLQLGQPAKAQAVFEAAVRLPGGAGSHVMLEVNLAESFRLQQKSDDALRVVRTALTRMPGAFELHNELGAVLVDLGRMTEAVDAYRAALAIAPNDTDSNFSLGSTLVALGRRAEAIQYLKRSLTLQPTFPKTLILLGHLALDAGNLEEAHRYWQPLYDSHPEQPTARHVLALYHLRAGEAAEAKNDSASAEKHYREGLAVDADNAEIQVTLGVLCLAQGRIPDALAPFEAYHRLRPKVAQSSLFLGQVYAQLGRFADARKILLEGEQLAKRSGNKETAANCREIVDHLPPG